MSSADFVEIRDARIVTEDGKRSGPTCALYAEMSQKILREVWGVNVVIERCIRGAWVPVSVDVKA